MMKVPQTKKDLLEHLKYQINFLSSSDQSYDNEYETEAIRMAVAIRILLHDTKQSKSLLSQLDKKNILFYDTARDLDPRNVLTDIGLALIRLSPKGAEYLAGLDDIPPERLNRKVPFDRWWSKIVIRDKPRSEFTRKELVLYVANQDGGAHIDPSLDEKYALLSRFNSMAWRAVKGGIDSPLKNRPELVCIRQITHEVLKTLKDEFPEYF
ncbi:MAG: hypothetical protein OEW69_09225 [Nitrospirota bacterium]|nr:hypothetical protein [Nitrospirota bacterium]